MAKNVAIDDVTSCLTVKKHAYRDKRQKMAKNHAFCNDICATINITHTRCNYTKVTKTKRILWKYLSFKYDTSDVTQIKFLMKLYELKTGRNPTYWTVALKEEVRGLFGGHDTFLICPPLRQRLVRLIDADESSKAPQTPQATGTPPPAPRESPRALHTFATPISPPESEPRSQKRSPRLAGLQPSPVIDNLAPSRLGFRKKYVSDFNSVNLKTKGNYVMKASGYNQLSSPSELLGNKDL